MNLAPLYKIRAYFVWLGARFLGHRISFEFASKCGFCGSHKTQGVFRSDSGYYVHFCSECHMKALDEYVNKNNPYMEMI